MTPSEMKACITRDFPYLLTAVEESLRGEVQVLTDTACLWALARALHDRDEYHFDHLSSLTAVDRPAEGLFTLVAHLWSYRHHHSLVLKFDVPREDPQAPTLEKVWKSANWLEREVYDLFGVVFTGHSDLRRILLLTDDTRHPLRKDFRDAPDTAQPT